MSKLETAGYTVGEVADLSGVTIRTLHHYDEIGLLSPGGRSVAGYRIYEDSDLERLQRILFYRELGSLCGSLCGITTRLRGRRLYSSLRNSGHLAEHLAEHLDAPLIQDPVLFDDLQVLGDIELA
ncbi:hypothetical protein BH20ACT12_BH20ACT12_03930 [soil metagenome]